MRLHKLLRETGAYVAASAAAFGIDFALLAALVALLGVPYLAAAAVSFLAGTAFVYWASVRHIFEYRRLEDARREFALFAAIGVVGLALNLGVMYLAVGVLGLHYLIAKCGAAGATFILNYSLRRLALFTAWPPSGAPASTDPGPIR